VPKRDVGIAPITRHDIDMMSTPKKREIKISPVRDADMGAGLLKKKWFRRGT
jgi:hypothetical protein